MVWGQMAGQRAQSGIKCRMHCLVSNVTLTTGLIRGKLGVHYGDTQGVLWEIYYVLYNLVFSLKLCTALHCGLYTSSLKCTCLLLH